TPRRSSALQSHTPTRAVDPTPARRPIKHSHLRQRGKSLEVVSNIAAFPYYWCFPSERKTANADIPASAPLDGPGRPRDVLDQNLGGRVLRNKRSRKRLHPSRGSQRDEPGSQGAGRRGQAPRHRPSAADPLHRRAAAPRGSSQRGIQASDGVALLQERLPRDESDQG